MTGQPLHSDPRQDQKPGVVGDPSQLLLEGEGWIQLPPLQENQRRKPPKVDLLARWEQAPVRAADLDKLGPLQVSVVEPGTAERKRWAFYLHRFHYLGLHIVGENLGYLIADAQSRDLACLLFGAAAWKCAVRDRFFSNRLRAAKSFKRLLRLPPHDVIRNRSRSQEKRMPLCSRWRPRQFLQ